MEPSRGGAGGELKPSSRDGRARDKPKRSNGERGGESGMSGGEHGAEGTGASDGTRARAS